MRRDMIEKVGLYDAHPMGKVSFVLSFLSNSKDSLGANDIILAYALMKMQPFPPEKGYPPGLRVQRLFLFYI
jgi:hypothetical protein